MKSRFCIFLTCLLFFTTCKKEVIVEPAINCVTIPDGPEYPPNTGGSGWWNVEMKHPVYRLHPVFNPNDPNEILFSEINLNDKTIGYYIFNLISGEKRFLTEAGNSPSVDWGKNDWILFIRNWSVYRIKSDGSGLTRLTDDTQYFGAKWHYEENQIYTGKILYSPPTEENRGWSETGFTLIMDFDGNPLDSIFLEDLEQFSLDTLQLNNSIVTSCGAFNHPKFVPCNGPVSESKNAVYIVNKTSGESTILTYYPSSIQHRGAGWLDENLLLWSTEFSVFVTDIRNKKTYKTIDYCNSVLYGPFSYNGNQLITHKRTREQIDWATLKIDISIVTMNLDGSNEKVVYIP